LRFDGSVVAPNPVRVALEQVQPVQAL